MRETKKHSKIKKVVIGLIVAGVAAAVLWINGGGAGAGDYSTPPETQCDQPHGDAYGGEEYCGTTTTSEVEQDPFPTTTLPECTDGQVPAIVQHDQNGDVYGCVPDPALVQDLNCGDPGVGVNVAVEPGDPHQLDEDGNGIGCEQAPVAAPVRAQPTFTG